MNADLLALGENIRRLRRSLKLSQEKLAEKCDLHRTYVCDVERGTRNPSFLTLLTLARAMGLTISELTRDVKTEGARNQPLIKSNLASNPVMKTNGNFVVRRYISRE